MRNVKVLLPLMLLVATSVGCAAMRASRARSDYLKAQTENLVIAKPLDQVWPSVQQVVFGKGYQLKQSASLAAYSMETETRHDSKSSGGSSSRRYLIQGIKVDDGSCRVLFTAFVENVSQSGTKSTSTERDWELELELLKLVDPAKAAELEQGADKQAEVARNQS